MSTATITRAGGVRLALDHLGKRGTSATFRRTRAHLALCRAVEAEASQAGLGHVHIGTGPCGALCVSLGLTESGAR